MSALFYGLWFLSPKTQNLRMYQKEIFEWNRDLMADKMAEFEFQYEISPGHLGMQEVPFRDKPLWSERDEIKMREKFFYK